MPTATVDTGTIQIGAGILRTAPLGTAEPTTLAAAYGVGWVELGATEEGSAFSSETTTEDIYIAERLERVKVVTTGQAQSVATSLAEITAKNLEYAFNGGTITTGTAGSPLTFVTFEPPDLGAEVRRMLAWDSEDGQERWIFRQVFNGGSVEMARRKAPAKTLIPLTLALELPSSGAKTFKAFLANARAGRGFTVNPA